MLLALLGVQLLALSLVPGFKESGMSLTSDPQSSVNPFIFLTLILIVTGFVLLMIRFEIIFFHKLLMLIGVLALSFFVFNHFFISELAIALSVILTILNHFFPKWYLLDFTGVILGSSGAAILGISFGIIPAIILLILTAIYDGLAVYKTGHMKVLAEGVSDLNLPNLLVIPENKDFKLSSSDELKGESVDGQGAGAFFLGLGDLMIPTVLVTSSANFLKPQLSIPLITNYFVLGSMLGSLVGLGVLLFYIRDKGLEAGLPFINGGAILGFLLAYLI